MIVLWRDEMDWSVWAKVVAGRVVSYVVTANTQVMDGRGWVFCKPSVPSDTCIWFKSVAAAWACREPLGGAA